MNSEKPLSAEDFTPNFPDHELIVYRNTVAKIDGWPDGFECLIAVPKAKLRELKSKGGKPPFWRHGEVMNIRPARNS